MLLHLARLAIASPSRRRTLRTMILAHLVTLTMLVAGAVMSGNRPEPLAIGNVLLIAGIVEGALLVGWRLTQIPKNQALEFVLVSDLQPTRYLLDEAIVAVGQFAIVTLSGLPFLVGFAAYGILSPADVGTALVLPMAWGLTTGLGLTAWAYEPTEVRRWGERLMIVGIVVYLVVGVLLGEALPTWLRLLPPGVGRMVLGVILCLHEYNPFGVVRNAMQEGTDAHLGAVVFASGAGFLIAAGCLWRSMVRLLPHFHDLHYSPVLLTEGRARPAVGDRPLSWWAVKRVGRYAGRINLYLAAGFTLAYSAYLLAGPHWPVWMGRQVFRIFEDMGGIALLTTALVMLAAVPAAFQYGVWDHDSHDRSRRLELLLLTELDARSYWEAAFAAAWNRGRGYFALAGVLWLVGWITGQATFAQTLSAISAGVVLWGLYFAVGFWAFSRGIQANQLGVSMTLLVPLATFVMCRLGFVDLAALLPPGSLFFANRGGPGWLLGPCIAGLGALLIGRYSLDRCDGSLRRWYARQR
jgi:hypothetical protein